MDGVAGVVIMVVIDVLFKKLETMTVWEWVIFV